MLNYIKLFGIALPIFLGLDLFWLGFLMSDFYQNQLGMLARRNNGSFTPHIPATLLVYFFLVMGLIIFVFPKVIGSPVGYETFLWGALYGFIVYGIYELTNLAVLANWPTKLVVIDTLWGAIIFGLTSISTGLIAYWLGIWK